VQPHSKENVSSFPATKLDIRLVRNQLQLLVRVLELLRWVAQCGRVGTKVRLAASLNAILAARKLTQAEAAQLLGVNQPKVSALKGYKLEGFSVERLMHFATALQHDVVIEIRPRAAGRGAARVMVVGAA